MRRDWDVVRQILLRLEALGDSKSVLHAGEMPPYDDETVTYHMHLMKQAGLIDAHVVEHTEGMTDGWAQRMTWEGHEFLDRIRDQTVWNKVKATARERGTALSFDLIKLIAGTILKGMLG